MISNLSSLARLQGSSIATGAATAGATQEPQGAKQKPGIPAGTLEALEQRLDQLRQAGTTGNLHFGLLQHFDSQMRHDRMTSADWLKNSPYAEQRRQELKETPGGGHLSKQYGLSIAESHQEAQDSHNRTLRLGNAGQSGYTRFDEVGGMHQQARARWEEMGGSPRDSLLFINTPHGAAWLTDQIHQQRPELRDKPITAHQLFPGLVAMRCRDIKDVIIGEPILGKSGTRPSPYAVMAAGAGPYKPRGMADVDTQHQLSQLMGMRGSSCVEKLRSLPPDHGHAALSNTAASLLEDLAHVLNATGFPEPMRRDPILANGLAAMHAIADTLPTLHGDSQKFANGVQVLAEELHVCLGACRPYSLQHLHQAASAILCPERLPVNALPPTMRLASSGMGAISQALDVARTMTSVPGISHARNAEGDATPVYFEMSHIPDNPKTNTLLATLNQSLPGGEGRHKAGWGVQDVISAAERGLKERPNAQEPLVMVLDATMETRHDMATLVDHFKDRIASGELKMLVCKSYQKFSNLGTAKVMAGGVGLIGRDDDLSREADHKLGLNEHMQGLMNNPESQLLTHMLRNRHSEFDLLDRATANASFVKEHCFNGQNGHQAAHGHDAHLPFIIVKSEKFGAKQQMDVQLNSTPPETYWSLPDKITEKFPAMQHLASKMVESRSSFGFHGTTFSGVDGVNDEHMHLRISLGQHTQQELMEMFYLPSKLMNPEGSQWGVQQAGQHVNELVNDALREHPMPPGPPANLAQRLIHIARAEQHRPSDSERLHAGVDQLKHQRGRDGGGMTLNKIASVALHLSEFISNNSFPLTEQNFGPDRAALDSLLHGLIHSGMPGVSEPVRQSVLNLQSMLRLSDMKHGDPMDSDAAFTTWLNEMDRLPTTKVGELSNIASHIPEQVYEMAGPAMQERLLNRLTLNQPLHDQLDAIQTLLNHHDQPLMAEQLLSRIEQKLDQASRQPGIGSDPRQLQNNRQYADLLRQQILMAQYQAAHRDERIIIE
ncbi:hypothetical protein ACKC9G_17065 [Pokkaliibacter sp. CJK22405]|uniref:hypothetical protein n=1 Tax=Pokkaliibacter sp. CJK22405 TaxID=3384615 RepID=UPI003984CC23